MSERNTFIRFLLSGLATLTGLLLTATTAGAAGVPAPRVPQAATRIFQGDGFDTCQAPDLATMSAWRANSAYRAVGIYFGGRARACSSQTNLTPDWVQQTTAAGWSLLPIYVGSQSPCVTGSNKNPYLHRHQATRPTQGGSEGRTRSSAARALGLQPGSALYLDMEAYDIGNTLVRRATTLTFVQAWDRQVRARGLPARLLQQRRLRRPAHGAGPQAPGSTDLPDVDLVRPLGRRPPTLTDGAVAGHDRLDPARAHPPVHGQRHRVARRQAADRRPRPGRRARSPCVG